MKNLIVSLLLLFTVLLGAPPFATAEEPGDIYQIEEGHIYCLNYDIVKLIIADQKVSETEFIKGVNGALMMGACQPALKVFNVTLVELEETFIDFDQKVNHFWQALYERRDLVVWIVLDGKAKGI